MQIAAVSQSVSKNLHFRRPYSSTSRNYDVVIAGAGLGGLAAAYHLASLGATNIIVVDPRKPGSLTSSRSTECYRNWWPDKVMMRFVNRSIDLLEHLAEQSSNVFQMSRRGYLFISRSPEKVSPMYESARSAAEAGAGPCRLHAKIGTYLPANAVGIEGQSLGVDVMRDPKLIKKYFSFLPDDTTVVNHVRRCGWIDTQLLVSHLQSSIIRMGGEFLQASLQTVNSDTEGGVGSVGVTLQDGSQQVLTTKNLIIAAGPFTPQLAKTAVPGLSLPLKNEIHAKTVIDDVEGFVSRNAPLVLLSDEVQIPLTDKERARLATDPAGKYLLKPVASGVHYRPVGLGSSRDVYGIWTYETDCDETPIERPRVNPYYGETVLRGISKIVPSFSKYFGDLSVAGKRNPRIKAVETGYYTKAPDNRPIIGPLPKPGCYILGGLSGFGIMASQAAGELLARQIVELPTDSHYDKAFLLDRFSDSKYVASLAGASASGQL